MAERLPLESRRVQFLRDPRIVDLLLRRQSHDQRHEQLLHLDSPCHPLLHNRTKGLGPRGGKKAVTFVPIAGIHTDGEFAVHDDGPTGRMCPRRSRKT